MQLWRDWLQNSGKKDSAQFLTRYFVNILPADGTLIAPLLLHARLLISTSIGTGSNIQDALMGPGHLLLTLVIIRSYLHRVPADDDLIWTLWTQGRLRRNWLPAEQAFAGVQGYIQIELNPLSELPKTNLVIERIIKFDKGETIPDNFCVFSVDTGGRAAFIWPISVVVGLSGGSLTSHDAPSISKMTKPRPIPRRLKRTRDSEVEKEESPEQQVADGNGPRRSRRFKPNSTAL